MSCRDQAEARPWASVPPLAYFGCQHVGVFAVANAGHRMVGPLSRNLSCWVSSVLATCPSGNDLGTQKETGARWNPGYSVSSVPVPLWASCFQLENVSSWGHLGAKLLTTLDGPPRQKVLFKYLHNILHFASWPAKPKIITIWPFTEKACLSIMVATSPMWLLST